VTKHQYMKCNKIIEFLGEKLKNPLLTALYTKPPYYVAKYILSSTLLSALCITVIYTLTYFDIIPLSQLEVLSIILFMSSIPLIMALYYTKISKLIRISKSERELPFVVQYLYMASAAGIAPSRAFYRIRDLASFSWFKKEISHILKLRILYALNPLDAIIYHFRYHPSQLVSKIIISVMSSERGGSDLYFILKEKAEALFKQLEDKINSIPAKYSLISSLEILAFIVLPICMLGIGSVFAILDESVLVLYSILLPLTFAITISISIDTLMPKELYTTPSYKLVLVSFITAVGLFTILTILNILPLHVGVFLSLTIPFIPSAIFYTLKMIRERKVISELPKIARDITEEIKKGRSPLQALKIILTLHHYPRYVVKVLKELITYLSLGLSMKHYIKEAKPPKIVSYFLELLSEAEGMGADPQAFETLTGIYVRIGDIYSSLISKNRIFKIGSYLSTLIMAVSVMLTLNVIINLISRIYVSALTTQIPFISSFTHIDIFFIKELTKTGILVNSFLLGLLGGKGSNGSLVYGIIDAVICTLLSMSIIIFSPILISLMI